MTVNEFRSIPTYTSKMREVLSDPIVQQGLTCLLDHNRPVDPLDNEPEIASVRRHSRVVGWDNSLRALMSLAETVEVPNKEIQETPTYGTGINPETLESTDNMDSDIFQPPIS